MNALQYLEVVFTALLTSLPIRIELIVWKAAAYSERLCGDQGLCGKYTTMVDGTRRRNRACCWDTFLRRTQHRDFLAASASVMRVNPWTARRVEEIKRAIGWPANRSVDGGDGRPPTVIAVHVRQRSPMELKHFGESCEGA